MLGADGRGAGSAFLLGLDADGLLFASGIDVTLPPALLTVRVAEIVQDHLTGHEAIQWPGCPGHRHPVEPAVEAGEAWWRCRSTGRWRGSASCPPPRHRRRVADRRADRADRAGTGTGTRRGLVPVA